ncbi:MAG: hypothetical protein JWN17_2802 [Frankiales bacterium]|nr:hypothetical protein [Frankiales bacterium]
MTHDVLHLTRYLGRRTAHGAAVLVLPTETVPNGLLDPQTTKASARSSSEGRPGRGSDAVGRVA